MSGAFAARSTRTLPLVLACVLAVAYTATIATALSLDVWSANLVSWHLGTTGSPFVDLDAFPRIADNDSRAIWVVQGRDGQDVIGRSPGAVLAAVPAYAVAGVLGLTSMSIVPGGVTAALLSAAAMALLFCAVRGQAGDRVALLGALAVGLATPVWTVSADGMWPHTVTALGIAGMAWAAAKERWWLVGVFGGVTLWGRLHAAVICAVLGLLVAWWRRDARLAAWVGSVSGAFLVALAGWSWWLYGTLDPTAAYDVTVFTDHARQQPLDLVNHLGFWISPGRGMLVWTPVLLVLAAALWRGWRELPDWSRALAVGGAAYTLMQLVLNQFKGGDGFFGYRIGLELLVSMAPAVILSAHRAGPLARRVLPAVLVLQFAAFLVGALTDPTTIPVIDDGWGSNELISRLVHQPALTGTLLVAGLLLGALAVRMWRDPQVGGRLSGPGEQ